MTKIKVLDLIVITPITFLIVWTMLTSGNMSGEDYYATSSEESIKVSVTGPDNDEQILSLDPYSPPSIVNDVHDNELPLKSSDEDGQVKDEVKNKKQLTNAKEFIKLFQIKRSLQVQAVNGLISIPKYEKRFEMVTKIFSKIFQLQQESKSIIENSPFIPGGDSEAEDPPLPADAKTLESLSSLIENCALIGDIILKLPDITHRILNKNQPWLILTKHCIVFTKLTRLLDPVTEKMLNLAAQEINLIPRDPNYVNPYRETKVKPDDQKMKKKMSKDDKKKKSKKENVKKGPKLEKKIEL